MRDIELIGSVSQATQVAVDIALSPGVKAPAEGDLLWVATSPAADSSETIEGIALRLITTRGATVIAAPIENTAQIRLGSPVLRLGVAKIPVAVGLEIDALGRSLDGKASGAPHVCVDMHAPRSIGVDRWFETQIKPVDLLVPLPECGRIGWFEPKILGSTILKLEILANFIRRGGVGVFCLAGTTTLPAMTVRVECGEVPLLSNVLRIVASADEPPGAAVQAAWASVAAAEHFASQENREVLLMIDDIQNLDRADEQFGRPRGHTVGALQQRLRGQTKLHTLLFERFTMFNTTPLGSYEHVDAQLWLSNAQADIGIYPAIDPQHCRSRVLTSGAVSPQHTWVAQKIQESETQYREACTTHSSLDAEVVRRHRLVARYLSQPFYVAAAFTGIEGASVRIERAISDAKTILDGNVNVPAGAMYMIGDLDDAYRKAKTLG